MSTVKTLALATFAAMSLGVGAAMAQNDATSAPDPNYGPAQQMYVPAPQGPTAGRVTGPTANVQAGSSDVMRSPWPGSGASTDSPYFVGGGSGG